MIQRQLSDFGGILPTGGNAQHVLYIIFKCVTEQLIEAAFKVGEVDVAMRVDNFHAVVSAGGLARAAGVLESFRLAQRSLVTYSVVCSRTKY